MFAVNWSLVQPFFTQGLLAGQGVLEIYTRTLEEVARLLRLSPSVVIALIAFIVLLHTVVGLCSGGVAIVVGRQLTRRLRSRQTTEVLGE